MAPEDQSRRPGELDSAHLAAIMRALANPIRIDLLKSLRTAHTLGEIRLETRRRDATRQHRPMNRVTARQHLNRLLELGMVRTVRKVRDGRSLDHYIVNQGQIFVLVEELRQLVLIRPEEQVLDGTIPGPTSGPLRPTGPKLALVNGPGERRVYHLGGQPGPWRIGRHADCAIQLDYDPYVSMGHAEVTRQGKAFTLRDLASRNQTTVNWEGLPQGGSCPLVHGDLIGVGRSLLVFRDA